MKKYLLLVWGIALLNLALCAESAPNWHKKAEKTYPSAQYIRAEGEGKSAKGAKNDAINQISLYFETKTQGITQAVESASLVIDGDREQFSSNKELLSLTKIESAAEFFCLNFTDVYYDEKHDTYFVMAYIDKKDAATIYNSRIAALLKSINGYTDYAKSEKEAFLAINALHKAAVLGELCERYIKAENTIYPSDTQKYQEALEEIAQLHVDYAVLKKNITFSVVLSETEQRYDPLFATICATLEKRGYVYSHENATYTVNVAISAIEEIYDVGLFVRPSIMIIIQSKTGTSVYTYSKTFPRMSSKTLEQTYTRVVSKLKSDIEEYFLAD